MRPQQLPDNVAGQAGGVAHQASTAKLLAAWHGCMTYALCSRLLACRPPLGLLQNVPEWHTALSPTGWAHDTAASTVLTICLQRLVSPGVLQLLLEVQVRNAAAGTVPTLCCLPRALGILQLLPEVSRLFGGPFGLSAGALQLPGQLNDAGACIAELLLHVLQGRAGTRSPLNTVTAISSESRQMHIEKLLYVLQGRAGTRSSWTLCLQSALF